MNITLTPVQEAFIRQAIERGQFERAEDAVTEALLLWEDQELRRADVLRGLDAAEASLDRGEGIVITEAAMRTLAEDVKREGRARRTAAGQQPG
jgi:Arc/MetJ-type ribon-helix-helix transcriptional regulator